MAEEIKPIVFVREDTDDVEQLELVEHDLPEPPVQWGGKVDETVTKYASDERSVQVHGHEPEPVHLEGVVDDQWWSSGSAGHAERIADTMRAMARSGGLIRMEYGEQRWGTFDAVVKEVYSNRFEYEIDFRPHWSTPPEAQTVHEFEPAPSEGSAAIADKLEKALATAEDDRPDGIDTSFANEIANTLRRAQNAHAAAAQALSGAVSWAEVPFEAKKTAESRLRSAARGVQSATERLKSTAVSSIAEPGPSELAVDDYNGRVEDQSRRLLADLLAYLREIAASLRPPTRVEHVVGAGETLQSIAQQYLGDWSRWTEIADKNDLDTSTISPGDTLEIPEK